MLHTYLCNTPNVFVEVGHQPNFDENAFSESCKLPGERTKKGFGLPYLLVHAAHPYFLQRHPTV